MFGLSYIYLIEQRQSVYYSFMSLIPAREKILFEGDTELDHYQVVDMVYEGRKARLLFSGKRAAAFSGMPLDGEHDLLFDYIQRFFELVSHVRPRRLLMIGGGAYTLPTALVHALPDILIDVIEIDAGLDAIAESFFGFTPHERLRVIHGEGKKFLAAHNNVYDMIIIDAFTDLLIPKSLAGPATARLVSARLSREGIAAINIISSYFGRNAHTIQNFYNAYRAEFIHTGVYPADPTTSLWVPQNFILISQKNKLSRNYGLRFDKLKPPSSNKDL